MSAIEVLLAKPVFQALGWALVHFIWQGAIIAALYGMACIFLRRCSANVRYAAACAALAVMLIFPLITMIVLSQAQTAPPDLSNEVAKGARVLPTGRESAAREGPSLNSRDSLLSSRGATGQAQASGSALIKEWASERFTSLLPWLVAAWLAGVSLLSVRFLGGLILAGRLKQREANPLLWQWQERLSSLAGELRVSRPVRLCESVLVEVPTVIGWLRPVILIPASALTGLSSKQLEAILAHELAHIRRYDYLINLLQTAVETLLFYHPAVWWVSGQIRQEREHCCDDEAVAACGSVLVYARALAELEHLRSVRPRLAMAATGGSLLGRIQRLAEGPARSAHGFESGLAGLIALVTVFMVLAGAQTTILSRSTPVDDTQQESAQSEAAPARAKDKLARDRKPLLVKSENRLIDAEIDQPEDIPASEGAHEREQAPSIDDSEQDEKPGGSQDFIGAIKALGYTDLNDDDLFALRANAVTPEFIREMNALMNQKLPLETLKAFRVHGVTAKFVSELRDLGFSDLSADQLTAFRIHGVTPRFINDWKSAGYSALSADQLTALRIHGVTLAFVQQMKDLGFDRLSSEQLTALRIHGVTPDFIQGMRMLIRGNISIDDLMGLRIHGVTPEFVKGLDIFGYSNLSADQVVGLRIHGVTLSFIQAVESLGFKPTADQLAAMRIHGVTPEFIQTVKGRGFSDVTVAQLIELRRLNITAGARKE